VRVLGDGENIADHHRRHNEHPPIFRGVLNIPRKIHACTHEFSGLFEEKKEIRRW